MWLVCSLSPQPAICTLIHTQSGDSSPKFINWLEGKIAQVRARAALLVFTLLGVCTAPVSLTARQYGVGQINSIWGRGWGKDRDNRWKRIETAFRSLVEGTAAVHIRVK